jgi:hypothetical protein
MKLQKILKIIALPLLLSLLFTTSNCTYKNAQEVYPIDTIGCNTGNVSFANDIVPILVANCYSCHSNQNKFLGSGYVLEGYANDTLYVQNNPPNANMYNNVSDANVSDFYHMPKGLPSISACEIIKIKAWIDQGYKNN